ncbi:hypothetical protein HY797_03890 [Candidatus Falkowbacteria bacterium]|nr:hypothetical protein [Candidatus Falkowbacteria bacterium]
MAMVIGTVLALVLLVASFKMFEYLDAKEIMVIQSPLSGELTWCLAQGVKYQGFGSVTKYPKRAQFWFSASTDQGSKNDQSMEARFNDGGKGFISGSLAWEMPTAVQYLTSLHQKYGSAEAIEKQLVRTVIEKSVYMTGPLMSSMESYATRRNELLNLIDDQAVRGVFKTETYQEKQKDQMTGQEKTVSVVKIIKDEKGNILRQDRSPLEDFGIRIFNLSINKIKYEDTVENQIKAQQGAIMQVQTAIAKAKEAEQKKITVVKEGEATAAKAKWDQEAIKATEVTRAQQKLEVATLAAEEAEQYKKEQIRKGEGEAERKRLVMQADGALEIKVKALVEIAGVYAKEFGKQKWVPDIMMGGGTSEAGSPTSVTAFMDLLTMKAAKDLGLDMTIPSGKTVAPVK